MVPFTMHEGGVFCRGLTRDISFYQIRAHLTSMATTILCNMHYHLFNAAIS